MVVGVLFVAGLVGTLAARKSPIDSPTGPAISSVATSYEVHEVLCELGVLLSASGQAGDDTAAAMLALVANSRDLHDATLQDWDQTFERCYVLARFKKRPIVPLGVEGESVPVNAILFGMRPNEVLVESDAHYYRLTRCGYSHLARVQDTLRNADLRPQEILVESEADFEQWRQARAE